MRVLMVSKACIVGIYQRKLELIAQHGVNLLALVPPSWRDERGEQKLERVHTHGYQLETLPIAFNGNFHLHFYPTLGRYLHEFQPDIVHIDEEPYNFATWHALSLAKRHGAKTLFFTWQNIQRRYLPPFHQGEQWVFRNSDYALAGTTGAEHVLRQKGYCGAVGVIPQFGVDTDAFLPVTKSPARPFTIGCVARLVPEKGIDIVLKAAAQLQGDWQIRIIGGGPSRAALEQLAYTLKIADRVLFCGQLPSTEMPLQYQQMDVLVVASRTLPNWKEQFGPRASLEAMAAGVPVIGSHSGAIPDVLADAGCIVPENDIPALVNALRQLMTDAGLYQSLQTKGTARVLAHFTHEQVANATVQVYQQLMTGQKHRL